jgi:hypothetical protein
MADGIKDNIPALGVAATGALLSVMSSQMDPAIGPVASLAGGAFLNVGLGIFQSLHQKYRDSLPPTSEQLFANHDLTRLIADAIGHTIEHHTLRSSGHLSGIKKLAAAARDYFYEHGETLSEKFSAIQVSHLADTVSRYAQAVGDKPDPQQGNTLTPELWQHFLKKIPAADSSPVWDDLIACAAPALYQHFAQACYECAKTDFEKGGKAYAALQLRLLSSLAAGQREIIGKIEGIEKSQADILSLLTRLLETVIQRIGSDPSPDLDKLIALAEEEISLSGKILAQLDRIEGTLSTVAQDVRDLKNSRAVTLLPWHPPTPKDFLVGRNQKTADAAAALHQHRVVVLHGPGGIGKTSLAAAAIAAVASGREDPGPWTGGIYLYDFYQQSGHPALLANLARQTTQIDPTDPALEESVRQHFHDGHCLIYLEGCEKAEDLAKMWKLLPSARLCLTTRTSAHVDSHHGIRVDVISEQDAADIILHYSVENPPAITATAGESFKTLATTLGCHSLACERAGILLRLSGESPVWLIQKMQEATLEDWGDPEEEHKNVFYLLRQTALDIAKTEPRALDLWYLLSLTAQTPFPAASLAEVLEIPSAQLARLRQTLQQHSLIGVHPAPAEAPGSTEPAWVLTHALLSEWARKNLPHFCTQLDGLPFDHAALRQTWDAWWTGWLNRHSDAGRIPGGVARYELFQPHLDALLSCFTQQPDAPAEEHRNHMWFMDRAARMHELHGRYLAAEPLYRRALEARERTPGSEHPVTLTSVNNLAALLRAKGDLAAAEPLYWRALEARERTLGPEHPDTLTSVNNLALFLKSKGDLAAAEPLYRRALEARERTLGPEHPDTLTSVNNLAELLRSKGELAAAEPLYRRALEAWERTLGPEHPDTLTSVNNLAALLRAKGDLAAAEPLFRRALEAQERTLGPVYPDTCHTAYNLAVFLKQQQRREEALPLARQAYAGWLRLYGENHKYTCAAANLLDELENK